MKALKTLYALIVLFAANPVSAQQFTLDGTVKGKEAGVIYLRYSHKQDKYKNDSAFIKNGHFHFKGRTGEPAIAFLTTVKSRLPDDDDKIITANGKYSVTFFLEAAVMHVSLDTADFQHGRFMGSQTQMEFAAFNENPKAVTDFIDKHPSSYVSPWLLTWHHYPLDTLQEFYNTFPSAIQKSICGKAILANIHKKELVAAGRRAPGFSQNDKDGKKVNLRNFRGKYVLLQFWASTNTASKEENGALLRAYDRYKSKNFTIIGASVDGQKTRKVWVAAVARLPWTQLAPLKLKDNPVARRYDVESLPANFLIGPAGNIIATNLNSQELQKTMDELTSTRPQK